MVVQERCALLAALADALAVDSENQVPDFSTTPGLDAEVEQLALVADAVVVEDVELDLRKGGAILFLTTVTCVRLPTTSSPSLIWPMRRMSRRTDA